MRSGKAVTVVLLAISLAGCVLRGKPPVAASVPVAPAPTPLPKPPAPPPEPLSEPQTKVTLPAPQPLTPEAYASTLPPDEPPPPPSNPRPTTRSGGRPPAAAPKPVARQALPEVARIGDRVLLPDFGGLSVAEVRQITARHGLEVEVSGNGRAVAQDPPPGTVVAARGARVRVRFGAAGDKS